MMCIFTPSSLCTLAKILDDPLFIMHRTSDMGMYMYVKVSQFCSKLININFGEAALYPEESSNHGWWLVKMNVRMTKALLVNGKGNSV